MIYSAKRDTLRRANEADILLFPLFGRLCGVRQQTARAEARENIEHSKPEFSLSLLSRTMRKVIADCGEEILERSPHSGRIELRDALRQYLARNRGISVDTDQIIVGSGAEYLYGLIVDLLGRDKTYAIESPSYEKSSRYTGRRESDMSFSRSRTTA